MNIVQRGKSYRLVSMASLARLERATHCLEVNESKSMIIGKFESGITSVNF